MIYGLTEYRVEDILFGLKNYKEDKMRTTIKMTTIDNDLVTKRISITVTGCEECAFYEYYETHGWSGSDGYHRCNHKKVSVNDKYDTKDDLYKGCEFKRVK